MNQPKEKSSLIDNKSNEIIHPYIIPTDISTWHIDNNYKFIIGTFPALNLDINKYAGVKKYLTSYKSILKPKPKDYDGKWNGRKSGNYEWFDTG